MKVESKFGEATISIEVGKLARQASGSVVVTMGETMVLATAVASGTANEGLDFLPLTVDYQESFYSVGRIPGNFFRREVGRPSEKETLTSRFIDRPCRPLFAEGWNFETQVIAQAISVDENYDPDMLAMLGASAALTISDIPFNGPIAGVKVARVEGEFVVNPTQSQLENADLNLIVACSNEAVVMVEGGADEASEEDMIEALALAQEALKPLLEMQLKLQRAVGKEKRVAVVPQYDSKIIAKVEKAYAAKVKKGFAVNEKQERTKFFSSLKKEVLEKLLEKHPENEKDIKHGFESLVSKTLRDQILNGSKRIAGRGLTEVRDIDCSVSFLPRAHGSAVFTRGETQSLGVATLGTSYDEQRMDSVIGKESKKFMLHYNFLPFCTNEVKRLGGPGRREIGHGALAERALAAVLPKHEDFPYTIRVVSDILESNGSSSMATICSGSLALMDAGVPLKNAVAGVAMGLIAEGDKVAILTDILGDEDHLGDMDFKIAGTKNGITAIQMDIKVSSVTREIMSEALMQAKDARMHILECMEKALESPREEISQYAPKIHVIHINPEKIRDLIGPGGKVIKAIQAETDSKLEVEDDGKVTIYAANALMADKALKEVERYTQSPEIDQVYSGKVVKIMDFGAFVEILPGVDGLVHISQLAHERVQKVTDILQEGDIIEVKVLDIDKQGKIRLSRKALLED